MTSSTKVTMTATTKKAREMNNKVTKIKTITCMISCYIAVKEGFQLS